MNTNMNSEESKRDPTHPAEKLAGFIAGREQYSQDAESARVEGSSGSKFIRSAERSSATGPRTLAGKQRSRLNALKNGIFSKILLLNGESHTQYESLLAGFLEYFQPVGFVEEVLVERLVTIVWRQRRLIVAEGAEIQRGAKSLEWDRDKAANLRQGIKQIEYEEQSDGVLLVFKPGLIQDVENPKVLANCIEMLSDLRRGIEIDGFDVVRDLAILEDIYGKSGELGRYQPVLYFYRYWLETSRLTAEEREREGSAPPLRCKENCLSVIDRAIQRLMEFGKSQASMEASRNRLDRLRLNVPESPVLDRLLRCEASLDRSFDRTLGQLERLQRMRRGQPVPPTMKVEISG